MIFSFPMMAAWFSSGTLFLVLLTGASYGYPAQKGSSSSSSYPGGYGADRGTTGFSHGGSSGSGFGSAGGFAGSGFSPVEGSSGGGFVTAGYNPGSAQGAPAGTSYSPHYHGAFAGGSSQLNFVQPAFKPETPWAVSPPSLGSAEEGEASGLSPGGPGNVSPPMPPQFQGGELYHKDMIYERGDSESETEEQGYQAQPSGAGGVVAVSPAFTSVPYPPIPGPGYPHYDYMFLTGQYPPGTYSDYTSSYEEGRDHWYDDHYMRHYYQPVAASPQQVAVPQFASKKTPQQTSRY